MSEPHPDGADSLSRRLGADIEAIADLTAAGVELDGQVQVAESTWVIYGHTSYDGEVVVGEYQDVVEATEVLRAAQRRDPEDARPPAPQPHINPTPTKG